MKISKESQKKIKEIEEKMSVDNREGDLYRARSLTVGTCFGGTTEVMMRGNNGYMWTPLQPVEVIELINQLAANVGCHVALKPKKDFASWRDWRVTDEEKERLHGWAPFVNDIAPYNQLGASGMDPQVVAALEAGGILTEDFGGSAGHNGQPGANVFVGVNNRRNKNVVATEKPKNRRSSKRTAKAA